LKNKVHITITDNRRTDVLRTDVVNA